MVIYYPIHIKRSREPRKIINLAVMSVLAIHVIGLRYANNLRFDNYSRTLIRVNIRCSGCIFNIIDNFICPLVECDCDIKGFGGTRKGGVKIGTIK